MKRLVPFLVLILLSSSCAPEVQPLAGEALPISTATPFVAAVNDAVLPSPSPFPSPSPSPSPSLTPVPPTLPSECEPLTAEYCITEGHFVFTPPILPPGNLLVDPSYRYGSTQNGLREPHHGVEFLNKFGTPVHAAGDGVVQFAGPDKEAIYSPWRNFYGNVVVLRHEDELYTLYGHLSAIHVHAGETVRAGDVIGEVGQSGVATGSHLHFEVRQGGDGTDYFSTQNPELWLLPASNENGERLGVVALSIVDEHFAWVSATFTLDYYPERNAQKSAIYYAATYEKNMMRGEENAALGGLPPGWYRIAVTYHGRLYERWIEVKSGKLTQVMFVVN
jgi:hypothetical protein